VKDKHLLCKWIAFKLFVMQQEAVLVNASRGPVIDEVALVEHLKVNPMFRVGLDVFEVKKIVWSPCKLA
jgi:phosphoglycerate dehydrogenase-like enzyme